MPIQGYDYLTTEPDQLKQWKCRVSGAEATVSRGVYGPLSWASAVEKHFRHHDAFVCPFTDEEWHRQAYRLIAAMEETPSKRIAQLMQQDLEDLLHEHLPHS
jgi:hypothetical protein